MVPAELNLQVYSGTTLETIQFTMQDSDLNVVDLTGWSVYAQVRKACGKPILIDLAPTITDAANGVVEMGLTDEQTEPLAKGNYYWDLLLENPTGEVLGPYIAGEFKVLCPITQT